MRLLLVAHSISPFAAHGWAVAAQASALVVAGEDPPEWIQIVPAGTFRGVDGRGPYTLDDPKAVIAASLQNSRPIPLDYNHQTLFAVQNGGEAPAAAWFDKMEVRDGAIWAHVGDWTPDGRKAVCSKAYRFVSPVFSHDAKTGQVTQIHSVGLVNNPNLAELPAINSRMDNSMEELLKALRQALGLPETATQDAVVTACGAMRTQAEAMSKLVAPLGTLFGCAANASAADVLKAGKVKLVTVLGLGANAPDSEVAMAAMSRLVAGDVDPAKFVPMAAFTELQGKVAAMSAETTRTKADDAVAQAQRDGKVSPALKDWAVAYASRDLPGFTEWARLAPAIVQPQPVVPGGKPPGSQPGVVAEHETAVCAALGISPQAFAKMRDEETV